jgi:hypothetical protein
VRTEIEFDRLGQPDDRGEVEIGDGELRAE